MDTFFDPTYLSHTPESLGSSVVSFSLHGAAGASRVTVCLDGDLVEASAL